MDKIAEDFKNKGVVFYVLYTREPHAGQKMGKFDFRNKKQTSSHQERVDYALEMLKKYHEKRPILIDTFGEKCLQRTLGGNQPNSLIVVDRDGKLALWQQWSDARQLRTKLEEMTKGMSTSKAVAQEKVEPQKEQQPKEEKEQEKPQAEKGK